MKAKSICEMLYNKSKNKLWLIHMICSWDFCFGCVLLVVICCLGRLFHMTCYVNSSGCYDHFTRAFVWVSFVCVSNSHFFVLNPSIATFSHDFSPYQRCILLHLCSATGFFPRSCIDWSFLSTWAAIHIGRHSFQSWIGKKLLAPIGCFSP